MGVTGLEELWEAVRRIPRGRVAAYGAVGRALAHPAPARTVGKWMARAPEGVPWWRVVGATGCLPIAKRSPILAAEQRSRLEGEGVTFEGDRVRAEFFVGADELADE